jgi:hypothetical protein
MKIEWHEERFKRALKEHLRKKMIEVVHMLERYAKRLVSKGNITGSSPSRPGEPPRVRTGTLRASVGSVVETRGFDVIGYLGVRRGPANRYAPLLEKDGIRDGTTRPFLSPTIKNNVINISRMFG